MVLPSKDKKRVRSAVYICRLLLAVVMMVSGFLKAADPVGSMYKLQEYATIFSLESISDAWLQAIAIAQSAFEFLLGLYLLVGIYRRAVPWLMLISMSLFVPLSLYLWVNGSISDCGCFGESVAISNRATFLKNLVLLALAVVVFRGRRHIVRQVSERTRWLFILLSIAYIFAMQLVSMWHLPLIDTGSFAVGSNLRSKVEYVPDEYDYKAVYYKKNDVAGEPCIVDADTVMGDEWVLDGYTEELVSLGTEPEIGNFSILDWEYDIEIADELLADTGYVCLVAIESVEDASMTHVDKINDLYDHCSVCGIRFCAATSSGDDAISLWRKRTGAEYPLYWADGVLLRSMIRSNPGLLLLKDGVIVGKWNVSDIPDLEELEASPTLMPDAVATPHGAAENWRFWVVLLFVGVSLLLLLDVLLARFARWRMQRKAAKGQGDATANTAVANDKKEISETSDINKNTNL